ncbi:DUF3019 domain-containing protein [Salinimonas sp. HHU 13199]|uniref:DUF3019 domain-containing protein n=1 Tax=Salinimonas profundi TaxID=2729140 RepID=A0ABR8LFI4_9ALTE|nr:DUF3019 domain-containing protein [Salinimonas profundi]MBD3584303.1 DUF3019 domain-containing protein [Salinimonas profundi]
MCIFNKLFTGSLTLLFCLSGITPSWAEPQLNLKPETCIRDENGECVTTLNIQYTDDERRAICVAIEPLTWEQCQQEARRHEIDVAVRTRQNLQVTALDAQDRRILSEATLILATFKPDATRKRRRFSWSY